MIRPLRICMLYNIASLRRQRSSILEFQAHCAFSFPIISTSSPTWQNTGTLDACSAIQSTGNNVVCMPAIAAGLVRASHGWTGVKGMPPAPGALPFPRRTNLHKHRLHRAQHWQCVQVGKGREYAAGRSQYDPSFHRVYPASVGTGRKEQTCQCRRAHVLPAGTNQLMISALVQFRATQKMPLVDAPIRSFGHGRTLRCVWTVRMMLCLGPWCEH